jgi:hypothetical protein
MALGPGKAARRNCQRQCKRKEVRKSDNEAHRERNRSPKRYLSTLHARRHPVANHMKGPLEVFLIDRANLKSIRSGAENVDVRGVPFAAGAAGPAARSEISLEFFKPDVALPHICPETLQGRRIDSLSASLPPAV